MLRAPPASRPFLALAAGLLAAGCAGAVDCRPEHGEVLPVMMTAGVPMVTVRVNGEPASMMLDTGATVTTLTASGAARLKLEVDRSRPAFMSGLGGALVAGTVPVGHIEFGNLRLEDARVPVVPLKGMEGLLATPLDGLLGVDVLKLAEIDLDLPGNRVILYRGDLCRAAKPVWTGAYASLPTWQTPNLRLGTRLEVNNRGFQALVDTGFSATTISQRGARLLGVPPPPATLRPVPTFGVGDAARDSFAHVF